MDRRAHLCLDRSQSQARSRLRAIRLHRRCLRPPRHDPYHAQTFDQGNSLSLNQDFPNRLLGRELNLDIANSETAYLALAVIEVLHGHRAEVTLRDYQRIELLA